MISKQQDGTFIEQTVVTKVDLQSKLDGLRTQLKSIKQHKASQDASYDTNIAFIQGQIDAIEQADPAFVVPNITP